ncbi:MAG: hypothetical protein AAFX93_20065 [Verrucomicrobiota bacterium]
MKVSELAEKETAAVNALKALREHLINETGESWLRLRVEANGSGAIEWGLYTPRLAWLDAGTLQQVIDKASGKGRIDTLRFEAERRERAAAEAKAALDAALNS